MVSSPLRRKSVRQIRSKDVRIFFYYFHHSWVGRSSTECLLFTSDRVYVGAVDHRSFLLQHLQKAFNWQMGYLVLGISGFSGSLFHLLNLPDTLPVWSKFVLLGEIISLILNFQIIHFLPIRASVTSAISFATDETCSFFVILQHLSSKSSPAKPQPGVAYVHWYWVTSFIIAILSIKTSEIRLFWIFNAECIRHKFCQRLIRSGAELSWNMRLEASHVTIDYFFCRNIEFVDDYLEERFVIEFYLPHLPPWSQLVSCDFYFVYRLKLLL